MDLIRKPEYVEESKPSKPAPIHSSEQKLKGTDEVGKGMLIGYDYLKPRNGTEEAGKSARIQSKLDMIKQLEEELSEYYE